jgi:hypothetical protein
MSTDKVKYKLPDMGNDWLLPIHMYVILSPQNSTADTPMFWGPNDCGYTEYILQAGLYTASQVLASPGYYNDGMCAVAIPLTKTAMRKLGFKITIDNGALSAFANREVAATKQL